MQTCFRKAVAGAAVVSVLMLSGPALAVPLALNFSVNVGGMNAMKLKFAGDIGKTAYNARVSLRPNGLAGLFIKKSFDLSVKGRFNDAHARPDSFSMTIKKKKKTRVAHVRWAGGRVQWSRKPGYGADRVKAINAALKGAVTDPLSMLIQQGVSKSANPCKGRVRIFDGHDVYDLVVKRIGADRVRTPVYKGDTIICRLTYVPIAGMSEKKKRRQLANPPVFTAWLGKVKSAAHGWVYMPVKATGSIKGRSFTAIATSASFGGKPLRPAKTGG